MEEVAGHSLSPFFLEPPELLHFKTAGREKDFQQILTPDPPSLLQGLGWPTQRTQKAAGREPGTRPFTSVPSGVCQPQGNPPAAQESVAAVPGPCLLCSPTVALGSRIWGHVGSPAV